MKDFFLFLFIENVALAGQCCHYPAHFRHRNMYMIFFIYLLVVVKISNGTKDPADIYMSIVHISHSNLFWLLLRYV